MLLSVRLDLVGALFMIQPQLLFYHVDVLFSIFECNAGNRDSSGATDPIENRTPLAAIKDNGLGASEKGDYATVRALVNFIKHSESDPWYTACTTPGCSKKVVEGQGGNWTCEKCNLTLPEVMLFLPVAWKWYIFSFVLS